MTSVVPIQNGINFRDLGGIKTSDGRQIRTGMLYRSGEFSRLNDSEKNFLSDELNLHDEITASLTSDDIFVMKKYSPFDFMIKLYQLLPFNNLAYKKLTSLLLSANGKPLVQHCAVGKDRTGVGVALTLFALGVSEDVVMQDYLLTECHLNDYRQAILSQNESKLSAEEFEKQKIIFAAKQEFLTAALDEIKKRYTTIDDWLTKEYQLDDKNRKILQDIYLI